VQPAGWTPRNSEEEAVRPDHSAIVVRG